MQQESESARMVGEEPGPPDDGTHQASLTGQREIPRQARNSAASASIGVALLSPDMEVLELNDEMRRWFPDVKPELRPWCYDCLACHPRETYCAECPARRTRQDGQLHEAVLERTTRRGLATCRVVSAPVFNADGQLVSIIKIVEDIADRFSSEGDTLPAAQPNQSIRSMTHALNNLLTGIIGYTELLLDNTPDDSSASNDIESILHLAEQATMLSQQISTVPRRGLSGHVTTDVNQLVEDILPMLQRLGGRDINVRFTPCSPGSAVKDNAL